VKREYSCLATPRRELWKRVALLCGVEAGEWGGAAHTIRGLWDSFD
jgi:hypothetical protein